MVLPKSICLLGILVGVFSPTVLSFASWSPRAISLEFPPAPQRGSPISTAGGGVRGDKTSCSAGETPLTALMPARDNIGKTVAANPTFFVYVPQTTATKAEFILVDDRWHEVYETTVELPESPGVIKLSIPETAPALEIDRNYKWQFAIICDPQDRFSDEWIEGEIRRIPLDSQLKTAIDRADPFRRAQLYANARIWNDTLSILAELRESHQREWEEFLQSVGLDAIASAPLAPSNLEEN